MMSTSLVPLPLEREADVVIDLSETDADGDEVDGVEGSLVF